MFINPYDLLGVTITSTVSDVKKAYYKLALICHEDKGGNKDDMIAVHKAYKFVLNELENVDQSDITDRFADIENEFKNFCNEQTEAVPRFTDIYADAFDLPKFNDYFNQNTEEVIPATMQDGYGYLMDKQELDTEYKDTESTPVTNAFSTDVISYKAPEEMMQGFSSALDIKNTTCNNYSMTTTNGLDMCDYKQAFTEAPIIESSTIKERTYEELLAERNIDIPVASASSAYTWSFNGMMDNLGNRIKDYLKLF